MTRFSSGFLGCLQFSRHPSGICLGHFLGVSAWKLWQVTCALHEIFDQASFEERTKKKRVRWTQWFRQGWVLLYHPGRLARINHQMKITFLSSLSPNINLENAKIASWRVDPRYVFLFIFPLGCSDLTYQEAIRKGRRSSSNTQLFQEGY